MTIDMAIAKLVFDAVDKDKAYKDKTEKLVNVLSDYKESGKNDFEDFLLSRLETQAYFCTPRFNELERYGAFLAEPSNSLLLPFVEMAKAVKKQKQALEIDKVLVDFLKKHNFKSDGNLLSYRDYIGQVANTISYINEVENVFWGKVAPSVVEAINCVDETTCHNLITLANARELAQLTDNYSIFNAYIKKVGELGVSEILIDAYDYSIIEDRATKLAKDGAKMYPLLNYSGVNINQLGHFLEQARHELLADYYKSIGKTNIKSAEHLDAISAQIKVENLEVLHQHEVWKEDKREK